MLTVDIKKRFGDFALDVSFNAENEVLAILGASGSGKSVTLKCIAGLERPDEGIIELDGRVLFDSDKRICMSPQERKVGYLFQHYALFPNMTVEKNIRAGVRGANLRREKAAEMLARMHLEGMENKYPNQLSGGQQQRVALARILVNEPDLLLLDEPFAALDSYLKWQLELELADILDSFNKTTVFVSHSRDEVYRLCDSVCVLSGGSSEEKLPVKGLFESPSTLSACLLTGCKNISRARKLDDTHVEALDWNVVLETQKPVKDDTSHIGVRAHYITPAADTRSNVIHCRVSRVVNKVFSTVVMLDTPGGIEGYARLRIELDKDEWASLSGETELGLYIPPESVMPLRR